MRRVTKVIFLCCVSWFSMVLVLLGNFPVNGQDCENPSFACPPSLCKMKNNNSTFCDRIACLGISPNSCPDGSVYKEKLTMCGCCPGCATYLNLGEICPYSPPGQEMSLENCKGPVCAIKMNECAEGLECGQTDYRCSLKAVEDNAGPVGCSHKRTLARNKQLHWEPRCEDDDTYSPKQCKGTIYDGTCFCVNKNGVRIFGREWYGKAANMTCACSRKVYELREKGNIATIHCTSDGNFEPLQCDMDSGLCYCVDNETGETNGAVVPENQWKTLPCYNRTFWGDDGHYLRQCESSWAAWMKVKNEAALHGLTQIFAGDTSICDYDGSFAAKQSKDNRDKCVYKNDQQIADYFELQGVMQNMNCQCARDTIISIEEGRPFTKRCEKKSGNYAVTSLYERNEMVRCVDSDGFFYGPEEVPAAYECCLLQGEKKNENQCRSQTVRDDCARLNYTICTKLFT